MEYVKKIFIILLAISILTLYLPKIALAQQLLASADVPKHEPQTWGTPEEDIPTKKVKKVSRWTWVILAALAGGLAYALGGDDDGDDDGDTGDYTGTW